MEDEKKITAPKGKKATQPLKKKSAAGDPGTEAKQDILELDDFKIDLVGEVKPARKTKAAGKAIKDAAPAGEETSKIVDAYAAQPASKQKSPAKEVVAADDAAAYADAEKATAKPVEKTIDVAAVLEAIAPTAETSGNMKTVPQTAASVIHENDSLPETEDAEFEKTVLAAGETTEDETEESLAQQSPVFKELATPKLPDLQPENRAWLQMQSPTRIFFYWSLKTNPYETLQKIFSGKTGNYALSVKLQNLTDGTEIIYPLAPYGSAWFDVKSDATYRAEVGLFDPYRPFIRLIFSNSLETPRLTPSPRIDWSPEFAVTSQEFAEVLDVSGYRQDAFEMALAGDDLEASNTATFNAFEQVAGTAPFEISAAELRLILFALASGVSLDDLRGRVSPELFAYLEKLMQENPAWFSAENILAAIQEHFGMGSLETDDDVSEITYSVVGASRINFQRFPKQFWKKFEPLGSS